MAGLPHHPARAHFCLDNTGVVRGATQHPSLNSQHLFREFLADAATLPAYTVRWVPGHYGVKGNEAADAEAKAGALLQAPVDLPTLYHVRRQMKADNRSARKQ